MSQFALNYFGTLDCGRGCPFACSFCTIINVHGKLMRQRPIDGLREHIIHNLENNGVSFYFFTDDNMSRHKGWRQVFEVLIELREEGYPLEFMMQIDTQAYKIPDFVEMAAAAGCTQVFIGMESVNADNLASVGKKQNKVHKYRDMINFWKEHGVRTHVGYIIGFPFDTPDSVHADIQTLADDIGVDMASFFMLTPLPGSEDHKKLVDSGQLANPDYNDYDTFRPVASHSQMSAYEWMGAYNDAWSIFYTRRRMVRVLKKLRGEQLLDMLRPFLWFKYAIKVNRSHPMVTGFHRLRDRTIRRPGLPIESRGVFYSKRFVELCREAFKTVSVALEFIGITVQMWSRIRVRRNESKIVHGRAVKAGVA